MSAFHGSRLLVGILLSAMVAPWAAASPVRDGKRPASRQIAVKQRLSGSETRAGRKGKQLSAASRKLVRTTAASGRMVPRYDHQGTLTSFQIESASGPVDYTVDTSLPEKNLVLARDLKTGALRAFSQSKSLRGDLALKPASGTFFVDASGINHYAPPRDRKGYVISEGEVFRTLDISDVHPSKKENDLILVASTTGTPQIAMFEEQRQGGSLRKLSTQELKAYASRREAPWAEVLRYAIPKSSQGGRFVRPIRFKVGANNATGFNVVGPDAPVNGGVFQGFKADFVGGDDLASLSSRRGGRAAWQAESAVAVADAMSKVTPIAMYYLKQLSAHGWSGTEAPSVLKSIEVGLDLNDARGSEPIAAMVEAGRLNDRQQMRPVLRLYTNAKGRLAKDVPMRLQVYALGTLAYYDIDPAAMSVAMALDAPTASWPTTASMLELHQGLVERWLTSPSKFAKTNPNYKAFLDAAFSHDMSEVAQPSTYSY